MSLVRELPRYSVPGHCIMLPGRRRDERGFFLFDQVLDGPNGDIHIGISGEGLRIIAERHGKQFGIIRREEFDEKSAEADALRARLEAAEARVEELEAQADRIAGLAKDGFKVQRKIGRPATKNESED